MAGNTTHVTSPRFIIIGYANHDVNRYPDGSEKRSIGGGGYFAALAASRVLSDVGLVTRVGSDFDLTAISAYLSCQAVLQLRDGKTACSIQTYNDPRDLSNRSIHLDPGVNPQLGAADIPEAWKEGVRVILASTMIPKQQLAVVSKLVNLKRDESLHIEGVTIKAPLVAVDSDLCWLQSKDSTDTVREMMSMADLVFMNRAEAEILKDLIPKLPFVVVKRDADGAELFCKGESLLRVAAPHVSVVDVTGAGDVFAGTLLGRMASGQGITDALQDAVNTASLSVTQEGVAHLLRR